METLIFSQSAIFRLQQLGSAHYHHTGERHKLATEEGILSLLRDSALIGNRKVRSAYDAFIMELNKRQLDALTARGVKLRAPAHLQVALTTQIRQVG
jgi:hypothetical protein